jgi:acyl-CoA synthetase (NDP forming)
MDVFFNPKSVVVIGASNSLFNLGATIIQTIKLYSLFTGNVYAVNRKGESVHGCSGYVNVADIPGDVELAVIISPASTVPEFVKQCAAKGIKHIIIESSGFSEGGMDGLAYQKEITATAKSHSIRIMGPNCLGVLNTQNKFCCFYGITQEDFDTFAHSKGSISYIIQSGGIVVIILESFHKDIVKVNKVVSIGNKSDIDEADMIEYFSRDESTQVIGLYLENVKNGRKLIETASKVEKPMLAFKVGRTSEGSKAAMSHTAGMANNDTVFEKACAQAGIIRLKSITELHSLPKIFTSMPLLKGKRIAVFTNSGAFGGITADLPVEAGLEMAALSVETRFKLSKTGQLFNLTNPIDLGPAISMSTFQAIFDILLNSNEVDGLLAVPSLWHPMVIEAIKELVAKCHKYGKPAAIYTPNSAERTMNYRHTYNVPLFESPEEAVRALEVSYRQYRFLERKEDLPEGLNLDC